MTNNETKKNSNKQNNSNINIKYGRFDIKICKQFSFIEKLFEIDL